jgi:uncharacterized protein (DUF488 family)
MTHPALLSTVGHGTLPAAPYVDLLRGAGVGHVVDIRSYPGSRRNPQYGRGVLEHWLPAAGIAYTWEPRLGGRRRADPASPHVGLRHEAFRGYADHMGTADFAAGVDRLLELAAIDSVAVMCSESVWWRCHRRLLADALVLLRGVSVAHLFHDGRLAEHQPASEARVADGALVYDSGIAAPLF